MKDFLNVFFVVWFAYYAAMSLLRSDLIWFILWTVPSLFFSYCIMLKTYGGKDEENDK